MIEAMCWPQSAGEYDLRFTLPVILWDLVRILGIIYFSGATPKMVGFWEFKQEIIILLFLALAVCDSKFPGYLPGLAKSPGGNRENGIPKGERSKLCENLFLPFGRQKVAKNRTSTPILDRVSRFFGLRFMFC